LSGVITLISLFVLPNSIALLANYVTVVEDRPPSYSLPLLTTTCGWRRGVAVECRTRDQEVAGSSLGRALRRKNSGQVSHTYVPLSPSSITWYRSKGGDALRLGR